MFKSYLEWLNCLRVGDTVDIIQEPNIYYSDQIKEIKQLSTNNYKFKMAVCNYGYKPLPSDSLIQCHQNPYKHNYRQLIHVCKECKYKCIYNNSFIIHRFDKITRKYLDSYCKSCYVKFKYQYLFTLITFYFNSEEMHKIIDINIVSLITKYTFEITTKIECKNHKYKLNVNPTEFNTILHKMNTNDMIQSLSITVMKQQQNYIIPCKLCSKLSLKATQCELLHGSKYIARCSTGNHDYCTECDSKGLIQCDGISCNQVMCNIRHDGNRIDYFWKPVLSDWCDNCGNPWICNDCVVWGSLCGICNQRSICNKCCKFGKCLDGRWRAICSDCHGECHNIRGGPDKSLRKQTFRNKYLKNKKRIKSKLKGKSYWKRKNDRKFNKLSMRKWNKQYQSLFIEL